MDANVLIDASNKYYPLDNVPEFWEWMEHWARAGISSLIAYVLARPEERCVVTVEVSKPSKKCQNRKTPDVCGDLGVRCLDPFQAYRFLGSSTAWKRA